MPGTFQGRRIVTRVVDGEEVEVVEGQFASRKFRDIAANALEGAMRYIGYGVLTTATGSPESRPPILPPREPVYIHYGAATASGESPESQPWALTEIRAEAAWQNWRGNAESVILAVLDTGIPMSAGALSHRLLRGERFHAGPDAVYGREPRDEHGHGTHVTGIAAAKRGDASGVAGLWPGPVYAVKVLDEENRGSDLTFRAGMRAALRFAGERKVRLIVNYSGYVKIDNSIIREAVEDAMDAGALLVCCAGNENGGKVRYPAAYAATWEGVIAVGASDRAGRLAAFSSTGPELSICAPGDGILSTLPEYEVTVTRREGKSLHHGLYSGTSMAAPFVAGAAALLWSQYPDAEAGAIRRHLQSTARRNSGDAACGILDVGKAIERSL